MSIAVLNQVYEEVRRLAVAGSPLAVGDFRLTKLVDPLRKSAQKAPVFGKVADAVEKLVGGKPQGSAESLLELATLTSAILYTQGETGAEGALAPIPAQQLGLTIANTGARVLKPLIEALTTVGSGRMETIKDAHERGAFRDLRLIKYAIAALNDKYAEIADYVAEKILPLYGLAIYSEIREQYDPQGKGDDGRRLQLLHRLDPEQTRSLVDAALDEGSKEVRIAAIGCLEGRADCVPFLIEQAKAKAKDVRATALRSLASMDQPKVIEHLKEALRGTEVELVAPFVAANPSGELKAFVVEEAMRRRDELLGIADKPAKKSAASKGAKGKSVDEKVLGQCFYNLLRAFDGRTDKAAVAFLLDCFDRQEEFLRIKAGYVDGDAINRQIAEMMLRSGAKEAWARLVERGPNTLPRLVEFGFLASAQSETPAQTYERFHAAYMNRPTGKSKEAVAAREVAGQIGEVLHDVGIFKRHAALLVQRGRSQELQGEAAVKANLQLDPHWLDAALACQDQKVILSLVDGPHAGVRKYLADCVDSELKKRTWDPSHRLDEVIEAMMVSEHPELVAKFLAILERLNSTKQHHWWSYSLIRLMVTLPAAAIEPLEAMLPRFDPRWLDTFAGSLDELKQRHASQSLAP